jgi:hypothetical protein
VFSHLSEDYISFLIGDDGVIAAYSALHSLHVMLIQDKSWGPVEARFGVGTGPGCLHALAVRLAETAHPRLQSPLIAALKDFFMRVVGNDPVTVDRGDAGRVLAKARPAAFQLTSSHFLGAYLDKVLRLEETSLGREGRKHLNDYSAEKAKQVAHAFEARFHGRQWNQLQQVSFAHFFAVMKGETTWLAKQLRRPLAE